MENEIKKGTVIILLLAIILTGILSSVIIFLDNNRIEREDVSNMIVNNGEINYNIDLIDKDDLKYVNIQGWASKLGNSISIVECYVCVKDIKDNEYYRINTMKVIRTDVTDYFNDGFNYDNSGFFAKFSEKKIGQGTYEICLLYLNDGNNILVPTGRMIEIN